MDALHKAYKRSLIHLGLIRIYKKSLDEQVEQLKALEECSRQTLLEYQQLSARLNHDA